MIEQFDGSDPVVQVFGRLLSLSGCDKVGTAVDLGQMLFPRCDRYELRMAGLIGCLVLLQLQGTVILQRSALLDVCTVYTSGMVIFSALGCEDVVAYQDTPLLVDSLNGSRAVQVVARTTTCVLLDSGAIHCLGHLASRNRGRRWRHSYGWIYTKNYVIDSHKVHSIACGLHHALLVTEKGSIFAFGSNCSSQLGLLDATETSSLEKTAVEVFTAVRIEIDSEVFDEEAL